MSRACLCGVHILHVQLYCTASHFRATLWDTNGDVTLLTSAKGGGEWPATCCGQFTNQRERAPSIHWTVYWLGPSCGLDVQVTYFVHPRHQTPGGDYAVSPSRHLPVVCIYYKMVMYQSLLVNKRTDPLTLRVDLINWFTDKHWSEVPCRVSAYLLNNIATLIQSNPLSLSWARWLQSMLSHPL